MSSPRSTGKHAAQPRRALRSLLTSRPARGRHRARSATPALAGSAPRVLGIAALAVATAGSVSGGAPAAERGDSLALVAATERSVDPGLGTTLEAVRLDREARTPRTSRGADRLTAVPQRVGTQTADMMSAAKAKATQERLAQKRAAEKRAAEKRAAEKRRAAAEAAAKRWRSPLASGSYRLTGRFGQCGALWASCHTGLDFAAPSGTPIRAIARGTVVETAYSGAYGNRTVIRLGDGTEMWYSHLSSFSVSPGQWVKAGQKIGTVGSTGNSTGPHLHLEIHPPGSGAVDPAAAFAARGVKL